MKSFLCSLSALGGSSGDTHSVEFHLCTSRKPNGTAPHHGHPAYTDYLRSLHASQWIDYFEFTPEQVHAIAIFLQWADAADKFDSGTCIPSRITYYLSMSLDKFKGIRPTIADTAPMKAAEHGDTRTEDFALATQRLGIDGNEARVLESGVLNSIGWLAGGLDHEVFKEDRLPIPQELLDSIRAHLDDPTNTDLRGKVIASIKERWDTLFDL